MWGKKGRRCLANWARSWAGDALQEVEELGLLAGVVGGLEALEQVVPVGLGDGQVAVAAAHAAAQRRELLLAAQGVLLGRVVLVDGVRGHLKRALDDADGGLDGAHGGVDGGQRGAQEGDELAHGVCLRGCG